jgi:hypothetical protein
LFASRTHRRCARRRGRLSRTALGDLDNCPIEIVLGLATGPRRRGGSLCFCSRNALSLRRRLLLLFRLLLGLSFFLGLLRGGQHNLHLAHLRKLCLVAEVAAIREQTYVKGHGNQHKFPEPISAIDLHVEYPLPFPGQWSNPGPLGPISKSTRSRLISRIARSGTRVAATRLPSILWLRLT